LIGTDPFASSVISAIVLMMKLSERTSSFSNKRGTLVSQYTPFSKISVCSA
jgi:hypothetical protein